MKLDVSEAEYLAAVSKACELVDILHTNSCKPLCSPDAAIKQFISAIYDSAVPCDVLNTLMKSDADRQNILFVLLVGRCKYGRPRHERADDMLSWAYECHRADKKLL